MRIAILCGAVLAAAILAASARSGPAQALLFGDETGAVYLGAVDGTQGSTLSDGLDNSLEPLSLSADGSQVLAYEQDSGTDVLATVSSRGGDPAPVSGTEGATSGSFAPDGASIVFALAPDASDSLAAGIYTVPVAGGTPTQVFASPDGETDSLPVLSPDGKTVAFTGEFFDDNGNVVDALELVPVAGGSTTQLATDVLNDASSGGRVSWSPDGATLVYAGDLTTPGIFSVSVAGGSPSQLTEDADYWPNVGADGKSIVFTRDSTSDNADDNAASPAKPSDSDVDELWSMNLNGSSAAVVAEGDYENLAVTVYKAAPASSGGGSSGGSSGGGSSSGGSGGSSSAGGGSSSSGGSGGSSSSGGGSSSAGGGSSSGTTTTKQKAVASAVKVSVHGTSYTVTWKGTGAAKWKVTVKVGKKTVSATVKGSVHRKVFTIRGASGKPRAAVKAA